MCGVQLYAVEQRRQCVPPQSQHVPCTLRCTTHCSTNASCPVPSLSVPNINLPILEVCPQPLLQPFWSSEHNSQRMAQTRLPGKGEEKNWEHWKCRKEIKAY